MFESLEDWVITVVETLGYLGVGALVALENLFPPIPSEVILPLAGSRRRSAMPRWEG